MIYIIIILWLVCFINMFVPNLEVCAQLPNWGLKLAAMFIFLIGSPLMMLGAAITQIIELIFPEGWNDDD